MSHEDFLKGISVEHDTGMRLLKRSLIQEAKEWHPGEFLTPVCMALAGVAQKAGIELTEEDLRKAAQNER